ncbi:MAG: lipopolysaccharide biosynthesis protein [Chloroflexota bacterium]|nr:MAG: lipopolysaccharide biosynthesis protein [Chloroflexota bacterium]
MNQENELAKATVKGTLWIYATFIFSKAMVFAANVILARLLLPDDFGLLALGLLAINYIDTITDLGVGAAVIYRQDNPERVANVAFVISVASGLLLSTLAFLGAPWVADFFDEPRLTAVMQALSVTILVASLGGIHAARMKKELDFKRRFLPESARAIFKGGISIVLALMGWGVWSLVWGHIIGWAITTGLYWWVSGWRPRFSFDLNLARQMVGYGIQMVLISLFGQIIMNLDYVFIGRRMDAAQLGFYTIAFRIPELVILNICTVVSQAIFPAFSKLQNDPSRLRKGFLTTLRFVALITVPAAVGMTVVAPEFVNVFYTSRWSPAIPVMQLLALYTLVYSLSFNAGDIYKATGRPAILNQIAIVRLLLTVPMLWYASNISILAVAAGVLAVNLVLTPLQLYIASRILKLSPIRILDSLRPAAVSTLAMTLVMLSLRMAVAPLDPLVRMILLVLAGALSYGLALWLTNRPLLQQVIDLAMSLTGRRRPAVEGP